MKKKCALLLAVLCLAILGPATGVQASSASITGIAAGAKLGQEGILLNGGEMGVSSLSTYTIYGQDEVLVPLPVSLFTWDQAVPAAAASVTVAQLNRQGIGAVLEKNSGAAPHTLSYRERDGRLYLCVKFDQPPTGGSCGGVLYLTVNGTRHEASALALDWVQSAWVPVPEQGGANDYEAHGDQFDSDAGGSAQVWLDSNTVAYVNLVRDKTYTGGANNWDKERYKSLSRQVPGIDFIVGAQLGYNAGPDYVSASGRITFDYGGDNYFVYDLNGAYVGRSCEKLPFACGRQYNDCVYIFSSAPLYLDGRIERQPNYTLTYYR